MYKVLLVDDEVHICQLIEHLIEWEELGAELCGVAHDGVEAYEMVQALKPHIVISDIRMSGMDGIGLLEKIREARFDCAFILVSGYRQFEYAQKAIQLGVIDYLVKPIKKKALCSAIEKSIQEIQNRDSRRGIEQGLQMPLQYNLENLISAIESGSVKLGQMTLPALLEHYKVSLPGQKLVIYGKCTCDETFSREIVELLLEHLEECFQENDWFENSFCARWGEGCLLIGASQGQLPSLAAIQRHCQAAISVFAHWRVVLGSCVPDEGKSFREIADLAKQTANRHYFSPSETTFSEQDAGLNFRGEDPMEVCVLLPDAMQVLDAKGVREQVKAGFCVLEQQRSPEAVFAYITWVIDTMNHALSAFAASHSGLEGIQYLHRNELLEQLYYCSSLRALGTEVCNVLEEKIRSTREAIEQLENKPVRIIREMVAQKYMEHISLNDAAKLVDLNPVYLSVLFKKETGINFKDYVTNVRMDKAKEFLRQGETINRVAELVGYQDTKYFSRLFARVVGVNPTQYKKLYQ